MGTRATQAASGSVEGTSYTVFDVNSVNGEITIDIPVADFDQEGTRVLWSRPTLRVRVVNGSEQTITSNS